MAIETVYETGTYSYCFDTLYGTSWFVRKKDDHVSLVNTGVDAEEEKAWAAGLLPNKMDATIFNEQAATQTYSPRWKAEL